MDSTDHRILQLLQRDARTSLSEIGKKVGLSTPAVSDRIQKLKNSGIIKGYTAVLDAEALGKTMCCYCMVILRNNHQTYESEFARFIRNEADIVEAHCISGEYEYLLKIVTESARTLERILGDMRAKIPVLKTKSLIALSALKEGALAAGPDMDRP